MVLYENKEKQLFFKAVQEADQIRILIVDSDGMKVHNVLDIHAGSIFAYPIEPEMQAKIGMVIEKYGNIHPFVPDIYVMDYDTRKFVRCLPETKASEAAAPALAIVEAA